MSLEIVEFFTYGQCKPKHAHTRTRKKKKERRANIVFKVTQIVSPFVPNIPRKKTILTDSGGIRPIELNKTKPSDTQIHNELEEQSHLRCPGFPHTDGVNP